MEAAGVLSITFGLGFTLSTAVYLLSAHVSRNYHRLCQALQLTYTLFLLPLVLWNVLQFSSFLLLAALPCSVLSVLVSLTDQVARVALTVLILFAVRPPIHNTGERGVLVLFVVLRAVLAAVVVGFTRSGFIPVCFPVAGQGVEHGRAPGITQVCFDGILMAISLVKAWIAWRGRGRGTGMGGLVAIVAAAMAWMIAAAPGLVKVGSVLVRLGPSVVALGVLLGLLRAFPDALFLLEHESASGGHSRGGSSSNGGFPPMGTRRPMHHRLASSASTPFRRRSLDVERQQQTDSTLFRSVMGQPIVHPGTMASWTGASEPSLPPVPAQPALVETLLPPHAGGISKISGPMLDGGRLFSSSNEGRRDVSLRTVSLRAAAADQERQREERGRERVSMQLGQPSRKSHGSFHGERGGPHSEVRRKPVSAGPSEREREREQEQQYVDPRTSAFTYSTEDDDVTTQYAYSQGGLAPADQRVLFVNSIEYDNPSLVQSLVSRTPTNPEKAHTTGRYTVTATAGILRRSPLYEASEDESPTLPAEMTPVIARKRPEIPSRESNPRAIFPSEESPRRHDRSRSVSSRRSTRSPEEAPLVPVPPPAARKQKQAPPPIIIAKLEKSTRGPPRSAVNGAIPMPPSFTPALPTPYETAKAWVESMAPVIKNSAPVLVDINAGGKSASMRGSLEKPQEKEEPEPIPAMSPRRPSTRRRSSATLAGPDIEVGDKGTSQGIERRQAESITIELRNEMPFDSDAEGEGSAPSLTTADSSRSSPQGLHQRTPPPSPPPVTLGDYDFAFSASAGATSPCSADDSGSIIFSDMEDGIEPSDMMHRPRQQQTQDFLEQQAKHFRFGDPIPTFSSTFRGQRRKEPPAPLGVVPPRARIPRPPTYLQPPAPNNRDSAIIRELEQEASAQENQWRGMRQTLTVRDSFVGGSSVRVSRAPSSATTDTTAITSAGGWQKQLAEAQMAYLSEAPILAQLVQDVEREETAPLDLVEEFGEEVDATPLQPTVYFNPTLELDDASDGDDDYEDDEDGEDDEDDGHDIDAMEWEMVSAAPRAAPPSLWAAAVVLPHIPSAPNLWSTKHSGRKGDAVALPAALTLRPRKRYDLAPPSSVQSLRLWTKAKTPPSRIEEGTGLWKDQKAWRPKSSLRKRDSAVKKQRVTWVEEVVTVETTGLLGKLKKLWWGQPVPAKIEVARPVPPPPPTPAKKAVDDGIARKYSRKALPSLPVMVSGHKPIARLWREQPKRSSLRVRRTRLWPSAEPLPPLHAATATAIAADAAFAGRRARHRQLGAGAITSTALWTKEEKDVSAARAGDANKRHPRLWIPSRGSPANTNDNASTNAGTNTNPASTSASASPQPWDQIETMEQHTRSQLRATGAAPTNTESPAPTKGKGCASAPAVRGAGEDEGVGGLPSGVRLHAVLGRRSLRVSPTTTETASLVRVKIGGRVFAASVGSVPSTNTTMARADGAVVTIATESADESKLALRLANADVVPEDYERVPAGATTQGTEHDRHRQQQQQQQKKQLLLVQPNAPSSPTTAPASSPTQSQPVHTTTASASASVTAAHRALDHISNSSASLESSTARRSSAISSRVSSTMQSHNILCPHLSLSSPPQANSPSRKPNPIDPREPNSPPITVTTATATATPSKPRLWSPPASSITPWLGDGDDDEPKQKMLWSKRSAKRTTEQQPEHPKSSSSPSVNLVENVPLPVASGELWRQRQETTRAEDNSVNWLAKCMRIVKRKGNATVSGGRKEKEQKASRQNIFVRRGKVFISAGSSKREDPRPVIARPKFSSRALTLGETVPVADVESTVEVKVAGRLWAASTPSPPPVRAVVDKTPLWIPETATRTTDAVPERIAAQNAPKKQVAAVELPKATGSLWDQQRPKDIVVRRGKVVVGSSSNSSLWTAPKPPTVRRSKSSVTVLAVEKVEDVGEVKEVEVKVAGRLWTAPVPEQPVVIAPASPLWSKETAMRTTDAIPERVVTAPRTTELDLPKMSGPLWYLPRAMAVKKGKVVVGDGLWNSRQQHISRLATLPHSTSSRKLIAVPQREEKPRNEAIVTVKVGGRLWTAAAPPAPFAYANETPKSPLWSKETAKRSTEAVPERVVTAPRTMSTDLPKAVGSLWKKEDIVVRKGRVVVSSSLWNDQPEQFRRPIPRRSRSNMTVFNVEKEEEAKAEKFEVKVGGRLWSASRSQSASPPAVATAPSAPLWKKETASRATPVMPERVVPARRKAAVELPKPTGSLWNSRNVVVKKGKVVVSPNNLWNQAERTQPPVLRKSASSRVVIPRERCEDAVAVPEVDVKVAGRLWAASLPVAAAAPVVEAPKSPLWSKETAKRNTEAVPERVITAARTMTMELPKATGSLWTLRDVPIVKKGKIVVSSSLWDNLEPVLRPVLRTSRSSRTVLAVEQAEEPSKSIEVKVAGRLWIADSNLPATVVHAPKTQLWTPEAAARTTTAVPERVETAPRKKSDYLPKASGAMWAKREIVVKKGRVVVSGLWSEASSPAPSRPVIKRSVSRLVVDAVERMEEEEKRTEVEVRIGGRLWTAILPANPLPVAAVAPLWTAATASRTTDAVPERVETAPRKKSDSLPKATGSLWANKDITVKKGRVVISGSLWDQRPERLQQPAVKRSASSVVIQGVERVEKEETAGVKVKVGGRLWAATLPTAAPVVAHAPAPLWTIATASRTTTAVPERVETAPRKKSDHLPKATGSLWSVQNAESKKNEVLIPGALWQADASDSRPVLRNATSSRTLTVAPMKQVDNRWKLMVDGKLWTMETTPAAAPTPVKAPLWSKETTERTTAAVPERVATAPRNMGIELTKAIGSLWSLRHTEATKEKVAVSTSRLWGSPEYYQRAEEKSSGAVEVAIASRLWAVPVPKSAVVRSAPLWIPATAARTTSAIPERGAPVVRKMSLDLAKASGSLWSIRDVEVNQRKATVNAGLWQGEGSPIAERSQPPMEARSRLWTATSAPPLPPPPPMEVLWTAPAQGPIMEEPDQDEFDKYAASLPPRETAKRNPTVTRTTTVAGSLWSPEKIPEDNYAINVGGRLWAVHHAVPSSPPPSRLWSPRTTPPMPTPAETQLWHAATASRTTTAKPGRSLSISRKRSINLRKATGSLWGEGEDDIPVPPLSRTSTISCSSEEDEEEYIPVVRMWQPVATSGRKGVVVLGQQRRECYYSSLFGGREDVYLERVGAGKVRISAAPGSAGRGA